MFDARKAVRLGLVLTSLPCAQRLAACARAATPALFNRLEYRVTPATLRADARRYR